MYNRKLTLEAYFAPEGSMGRNEATWVMTKDRILVKQNIILDLWDLERKESVLYLDMGNIFYSTEFYDDMRLNDRVLEMSKRFNGTHSRNRNFYFDSASFGILQKDELIEYADYFSHLLRSR